MKNGELALESLFEILVRKCCGNTPEYGTNRRVDAAGSPPLSGEGIRTHCLVPVECMSNHELEWYRVSMSYVSKFFQ